MISRTQIRAGRALVGLNQKELADLAGCGVATIRRIEGAEDEISGAAQTMAKIQQALESAGIVFIDQDQTSGPGVRLNKPIDR